MFFAENRVDKVLSFVYNPCIPMRRNGVLSSRASFFVQGRTHGE